MVVIPAPLPALVEVAPTPPALEFVVSGTGTSGIALDSAAPSESVVVVAARFGPEVVVAASTPVVSLSSAF